VRKVILLLQQLFSLDKAILQGWAWEDGRLLLDVRPRRRRPHCGRCGRRAAGYDRREARRWRHLGSGEVRVFLRYAPRRVRCRHCGIRVEEVPWARAGSRFTRHFEELAAYLAQVVDRTQASRLLGISWRTVGDIVERVVQERLDSTRLRDLRRIGVDELSYRRRHRYLTVVVDHDRRRVVWAGPGHGSAALEPFFALLGPRGRQQVELVTMDMSQAYRRAVTGALPRARIVYDRFHLASLANDAVDEVRRQQLRELRGTPEGKVLFGSRFALWKNPWNLTRKQRRQLAAIERSNRPLYRAYLLKEGLARALDYRQPWRARQALEDWLHLASRSRLRPFQRLARTVRRHLDGILGYVEEQLSNGLVEGINRKIRTVTTRAYGFHSPEALIAMIYLCCAGIPIHPPLP